MPLDAMAKLALERTIGEKRWLSMSDKAKAEKVYDLTMALKLLGEAGFSVIPPLTDETS